MKHFNNKYLQIRNYYKVLLARIKFIKRSVSLERVLIPVSLGIISWQNMQMRQQASALEKCNEHLATQAVRIAELQQKVAELSIVVRNLYVQKESYFSVTTIFKILEDIGNILGF